ncbi:MAG: hypothetical protein PHW76_02380 [Alphaproteobacteria bacterium]|nr:hypothetical protein [Alphaproteobacteria bacterium]
MSILAPARGDPHALMASFPRSLFEAPYMAGRKITAGFSYLQRIGKSGAYDVWFPEDFKAEIRLLEEAGIPLGPERFGAEWAAVRQFELLHEAGNYKIYDLKAETLLRSFRDLTRSMRAGGYRITVATLGRYEDESPRDELEILDRRLQEGIAQMIHMLYLEESSEQANAESDERLESGQWDYRQDLPHIGIALGSRDLFRRPPKDGSIPPSMRKNRLAKQFFEIINKLPQTHIVHDTAVGLQLPELIGENHWIYLPDSDETFSSFNRLLTNLFEKFDNISLSRLHGREDAHDEIKAASLHLRGYGDRLNESNRFYRSASLALN